MNQDKQAAFDAYIEQELADANAEFEAQNGPMPDAIRHREDWRRRRNAFQTGWIIGELRHILLHGKKPL